MSYTTLTTSKNPLGELQNFSEIARQLLPEPGDIPQLQGLDVWGGTLPLNGVLGGDHIIFVDFKQRYDLPKRIREAEAMDRPHVVEHLRRCQTTAGIAVLDVSGHHSTDALMAAMFHQAFLVGALYELDTFGHITNQLFENLNTRFYNSSATHKFVSLIYGEIAEDATFRFLSAAQPLPLVFSSAQDRFVEVDPGLRRSCPPIGIMPSLNVTDRHAGHPALGFKDPYEVNEWVLIGSGDILLLYSDGLAEHASGSEPYFPHHLEQLLSDVKNQSAQEIFAAIRDDLLAFSPASDDISVVVIKRL